MTTPLMYSIEYKEEVLHVLKSMSAYLRRRLLDTIENQLSHEPSRTTRNRKLLVDLQPPWDHVGLVWELRIGAYRAFYEVDEAARLVMVHALRHKPPHRTLEEIL